MKKAEFEFIEQLLRNYDNHLRDKAEQAADMMADWADASQSETIRYAQRYDIILKERQRVHDSLLMIHVELKEGDAENE